MAGKAAYYIAFSCLVVSFILCAISFGTGYWYEAEGDDRLFTRLGLWEACFNGYEHTSDYIGKAYYGCWWIFHKEYSYIRDWILPPWFKAIQALMTFGLVLEVIALCIFPGAGAIYNENTNKEKTASVIMGLATGCLATSVTLFGIMIGEDRTWMPRHDIDKLSWSFGVAVLSAFFAIFSCIAMVVYTLVRQHELEPKNFVDTSFRKGGMHMVPKI